jgi:diguanylate cyclase (GGDEF)-like protein
MAEDLRKQLEELRRQNESLKKALKSAYTDSLTRLWNRNYYEKFHKKFDSAKHGLGVIYLDANKLKKINDKYGHKAGDDYLSEIGKFVQSCLKRKSDFAFRIGGDEFLVVLALTGSNPQKALDTVCGRIMTQLAKTNKKRLENEEIELSFAMGCALKNEDENLQSAILRAEEKMYEHKKLQIKQDPSLARE